MCVCVCVCVSARASKRFLSHLSLHMSPTLTCNIHAVPPLHQKKRTKKKRKKERKRKTHTFGCVLIHFKAKRNKTKQTKCQVSASTEWPELWDELPFNSDTGFVLETCNHSILSLKRKEKKACSPTFFFSSRQHGDYVIFPPVRSCSCVCVCFYVSFFCSHKTGIKCHTRCGIPEAV